MRTWHDRLQDGDSHHCVWQNRTPAVSRHRQSRLTANITAPAGHHRPPQELFIRALWADQGPRGDWSELQGQLTRAQGAHQSLDDQTLYVLYTIVFYMFYLFLYFLVLNYFVTVCVWHTAQPKNGIRTYCRRGRRYHLIRRVCLPSSSSQV